MVKVTLNGKETSIDGKINLAQLLAANNIVPELVACEVNGNIVRRKDYKTTLVSDGDRIEVLQMIGGG